MWRRAFTRSPHLLDTRQWCYGKLPVTEAKRTQREGQLRSASTEKAHGKHPHPGNHVRIKSRARILLKSLSATPASTTSQIEPLQQLRRQKLRLPLSRFSLLFRERVADTVELVHMAPCNILTVTDDVVHHKTSQPVEAVVAIHGVRICGAGWY